METYLRCMTGDLPRSWSSWDSLAKFWYNTNFYTTINVSPFQASYRVQPSLNLPYIHKDSRVEVVDSILVYREATIRMLKHYLSKAQHQMKIQADKHRTECIF